MLLSRAKSLNYSFARYFNSSALSNELINCGVLSICDEVRDAIAERRPVVALESTIITHGLPYPDNVKCATDVELAVRQKGVVPATIAILDGMIRVGLNGTEIEKLGDVNNSKPIKTSRRDLPYVIGCKKNGGTTVSGTLIVAHKLGIPIFATGGIGGVHRKGEVTFDISADLIELGRSGVAVVSSGVKSILDIPKTLEYLETQGVFVATLGQTPDFPAFYCRKSGYQSPYWVTSPTEAATIISSSLKMSLQSSMLFAVPVPEREALDDQEMREAVDSALEDAERNGIIGKEITPFLLQKIWETTQGKSLQTNVALIKNNASVAADIAVELAKIRDDLGSENGKGESEKIVVIGGSNLDICVKVDNEDIKTDGRVHHSKMSYVAGGVARNVSEALTKMGTSVDFITAVGDDHSGRLLRSMTTQGLIKDNMIFKGQNTTQCIIILDSKGDCSCLFGDFNIVKQLTPEKISSIEKRLSKTKLIVVDGNPTVEAIDEILKIALKHNVPVFFEPTDIEESKKPFKTSHWDAVKFITPNLNELNSIASQLNIESAPEKLESIDDIGNVAKKVADHVSNVIVTLGPKGALVARRGAAAQPFLNIVPSKDIQIRYYPGKKIDNIVNVSGAGDCFAAGLITSILDDCTEEECIRFAFDAAVKALHTTSTVTNDLRELTYQRGCSIEYVNLK